MADNKRSFSIRWFQPKVLVWCALIVSCFVLGPKLTEFAPGLEQRPEYLVDSDNFHITPPPEWLSSGFVNSVLQTAELEWPVSLLDGEVTQRLSAAFEQHPWVEKVRLVEKKFPAQIFVDLDYRQPVAMVRVGRGHYPIDRHAVLLPPRDFSEADTTRFPLITSVMSVPGAVGTVWQDPSVLGAAELADRLMQPAESKNSKVLHTQWSRFQLREIRVPGRHSASQLADDLVFELITRGGSSIIWGRAPGSDHPGELSTDQKLGRLEKYISAFGSFDDQHGPYELDIRHWRDISRRTLAIRPAQSL